MAFNDTLFQLGMDLTRSSTAQTEELGEAALHGAHSDGTAKVVNVKMSSQTAHAPLICDIAELVAPSVGTHVTIDLHGAAGLSDFKTAAATLTRLADDAGANLQHLHIHPMTHGGAVSGVAVLENGHITFHSRPSAGYAALDISTFGGSAPHVWTLAAKSAFSDAKIAVAVRSRGETVGSSSLPAVVPQQRRSRQPAKAVRVQVAA